MGELQRAHPVVDSAAFPPEAEDAALEPGLRKVVGILREFGGRNVDPAKPVSVHFDFSLRPVEVLGRTKVEGLVLERTRLVGGKAEGTGETLTLDCGMVVSRDRKSTRLNSSH